MTGDANAVKDAVMGSTENCSMFSCCGLAGLTTETPSSDKSAVSCEELRGDFFFLKLNLGFGEASLVFANRSVGVDEGEDPVWDGKGRGVSSKELGELVSILEAMAASASAFAAAAAAFWPGLLPLLLLGLGLDCGVLQAASTVRSPSSFSISSETSSACSEVFRPGFSALSLK